MKPVGHHGQNDPFPRSNDPQITTILFSVVEFRLQFCQKLSWTSVNIFVMEQTLDMELVGHHGQINPFSRSNEPHMDIRLDFSQ
ncbi:hypothetical protein H5410_031950 [Solanum commersonii]|uniref:Uncharacterized protein n=1 Tax=Solanum commersonii TaxID=4109 RepID=A0A9J5YN77_SOLCO|nr:hypothetical protein H5410_031950 [Solanum commersonii]